MHHPSPSVSALAWAQAVLCLATGCTSFRQAQPESGDIPQAILSGELVKPGDSVRLATADGTVHEFRVTAIDREGGRLVGDGQSVAIADIAAIETREVSMGKTALLAGGGATVLILVILAAIPAIVVL